MDGQVFLFCAVMCAIAMVAVSLTVETEDTSLPDTYRDILTVAHNHLEQREVQR